MATINKCFAFAKLDAGDIHRVKKTAFGRRGKTTGMALYVVEMMIEQQAKETCGFDRDILEWSVPEEVLAVLLKDRSTGRNLIWATDRQRGMEYGNFR